jgi:phosphate:Na+ symporter
MHWAAYLQVFAGLGLFFVGINLLSDNLKSFGKPHVRRFINALAGSDVRGIACGALSGAVTNSGKAVTFSLMGLVSAGTLSVRQCLPIILGASFGSSLLVLWVSIDFKMLELVMLGVAGLYYQFGDMKSERTKLLAGFLLGLGLIFFGLDMLKSGASSVRDNPQFIQFLMATHGYWLLAMGLGAVGAFVTQSGSTISIVAITFVNAGLLDFDQTVMFVYGTNIGSGVSTAMLALTLAGTSRQLVMFHAAVKVVGALLLIPLLYLETYAAVPGVKAFAALFSPSPATEIGTIYVVYEVISGLLLLVVLTPASRVLAKLWSPTKEETLSRLHYLPTYGKGDFDAAVTAIAKEQVRLLRRATRYFDLFRPQLSAEKRIPRSALHEANVVVQGEIERHLADVLKQSPPQSAAQQLFLLHSGHRWIADVNKGVNDLVPLLEKGQSLGIPAEFLVNIVSSVDALFMAAHGAVASGDMRRLRLLADITQQRETLIQRFDPNHLEGGAELQFKAKKTMLEIIICYEAITWSINKLAHTLLKGGSSALVPARDPWAERVANTAQQTGASPRRVTAAGGAAAASAAPSARQSQVPPVPLSLRGGGEAGVVSGRPRAARRL